MKSPAPTRPKRFTSAEGRMVARLAGNQPCTGQREAGVAACVVAGWGSSWKGAKAMWTSGIVLRFSLNKEYDAAVGVVKPRSQIRVSWPVVRPMVGGGGSR